jgi:hypothetical protein
MPLLAGFFLLVFDWGDLVLYPSATAWGGGRDLLMDLFIMVKWLLSTNQRLSLQHSNYNSLLFLIISHLSSPIVDFCSMTVYRAGVARLNECTGTVDEAIVFGYSGVKTVMHALPARNR